MFVSHRASAAELLEVDDDAIIGVEEKLVRAQVHALLAIDDSLQELAVLMGARD